jgi:hypothetical protein
VAKRLPVRILADAASQHDADQNGRYFHHRQQNGHLRLDLDVGDASQAAATAKVATLTEP